MPADLAFSFALLLVAALLSTGCGASPTNPSFPITISDANRELGRITADPRPLDRPLLIIGGFMDPGLGAGSLARRFRSLTGDRRIVVVALGDCFTLDGCSRKIVEAVNRSFPSPGDTTTKKGQPETIGVDVIGYSLGGMAARCAAQFNNDDPKRCRLRIARLFTISSPNRGAIAAQRMPLLLPIQKDLRPGSEWLARFNASTPDYPIYSYVRLGDNVIGFANAAPPGRLPWWVGTPPLGDPHNGAFADPRIIADIARRLRDETPLTTEPAAALAGQCR
jgi:hypothetical protein